MVMGVGALVASRATREPVTTMVASSSTVDGRLLSCARAGLANAIKETDVIAPSAHRFARNLLNSFIIQILPGSFCFSDVTDTMIQVRVKHELFAITAEEVFG